MPVAIVEQTAPPARYAVEVDLIRAAHKVIAKIRIAEKPGWQDDGWYLCDLPDFGGRYLDEIRVRTKRGAVRKEPRGTIRYSQESGKHMHRFKFVDLRPLAGEA